MTAITRPHLVTASIAAIGATLVAVSLLLPRWITSIGLPLDGVLIHDFGVVEIIGRERTVEHEFALVNRTSAELRVLRIISTCGCLEARANREVVAPGETLLVNASMRLFDSGKKAVQISVFVIASDDPVVLMMEATALQSEALYTLQTALHLHPARPAQLTLYVVSRDVASPPPAPKFTTVSNVAVEFEDWTLVHRDSVGSHQVARWEGTAHIRCHTDRSATESAEIQVQVGEMAPLQVRCIIEAPKS